MKGQGSKNNSPSNILFRKCSPKKDCQISNPSKGKIKSKWIYEIINFPKNEPNEPYVLKKTLRAETLQIFRFIFWKLMIS